MTGTLRRRRRGRLPPGAVDHPAAGGRAAVHAGGAPADRVGTIPAGCIFGFI